MEHLTVSPFPGWHASLTLHAPRATNFSPVCTLSSTYISLLCSLHTVVYLYSAYCKKHSGQVCCAVCENAALGKFIAVQRLTERCTKTVTKGLTLLYSIFHNILFLKLEKVIELFTTTDVCLLSSTGASNKLLVTVFLAPRALP